MCYIDVILVNVILVNVILVNVIPGERPITTLLKDKT